MQSLGLRIVFFLLHFEKQIILPGLKDGSCRCACREELPGGGWGCPPRQELSRLDCALNDRVLSGSSRRNPSEPS